MLGRRGEYVVDRDVLYARRPAIESEYLVRKVYALPSLEVMNADAGSTRPFGDILGPELAAQLCLQSGDLLGTGSRESVECWRVWVGLTRAVVLEEMLVARAHRRHRRSVVVGNRLFNPVGIVQFVYARGSQP